MTPRIRSLRIGFRPLPELSLLGFPYLNDIVFWLGLARDKASYFTGCRSDSSLTPDRQTSRIRKITARTSLGDEPPELAAELQCGK